MNKKQEQLNMSVGKASNRLNRLVIFSLIKKCGLDKCYRCGSEITSVNTMSLDHIKDWLDSGDPVGLFFDTDNIKFSHPSCNSSMTRRTKYFTAEEKATRRKVTNKRKFEDSPRKNVPHKKLHQDSIDWARANSHLSIRERARQLKVHHETLRRIM